MLENLILKNPNNISEENIKTVEKQLKDSEIDLNYIKHLKEVASSKIPVLEAIALKMCHYTHNYFILKILTKSSTKEISEEAKKGAAKAKKSINPRHLLDEDHYK